MNEDFEMKKEYDFSRAKRGPINPEDTDDETLEINPRFNQLIAHRRANYQKNGGVSIDTVRQNLIKELIQDLNHPDPQIRYEAVQHLVTLGEEVIPALQEMTI
jgi:hypothetical protein